MKKFTAVILAGGEGKRMKSSLPKALCDLAGKPLIYYSLREVVKLKKYLKEIVVVTGYKAKLVEKAARQCLPAKTKIKFAYQSKLLGTANALSVAARKITQKNVLVLCVDTPLIRAQTLKSFVSDFLNKNLSCSLLTAKFTNENSLGVILRDEQGRLRAIREKVSLSRGAGKKGGTEEVNSGIYCFKRDTLIKNLSRIKRNKKKKEYFLTDIIEILYNQNKKVKAYVLNKPEEISGVNTQGDLWGATKAMRYRALEALAASGVKIIDPDTTFVETGARIGKNTTIYPFTYIEKDAIIGSNCFLGPFIRIRGNSLIGDNTQAGNFLELNRTRVGKKVRIKHFGYLGDTQIAKGANIGAGTVVANYDGKRKRKTDIGEDTFIGCDTVLVAPVKVGKGAVTGAGSVVTKNVKPNTVVVGIPAKRLKKKRG